MIVVHRMSRMNCVAFLEPLVLFGVLYGPSKGLSRAILPCCRRFAWETLTKFPSLFVDSSAPKERNQKN